jgi:hypothetical protein
MDRLKSLPNWLRPTLLLGLILLIVAFVGYQLELTLPGRPPNINNTYTPLTKSPPNSVGSYDVLGYALSKEEADQILQTQEGRELLSADNGAVKVTEELIDLGRDAIYRCRWCFRWSHQSRQRC